MKSRVRVAAAAALVTACAPVIASATVLFQDDFNAGTSASRYDQFSQDVSQGTHPPYDTNATFNFNYGNYTYFYTSADFSNPNLSAKIPQAPRSVAGAPTIGLRFDANNVDDAVNPDGAVMSIYPKVSEYLGGQLPSGDHKLTVDVWMNYSGPWEGNSGSMEWFTAGVNQAGGGIGGLILSGNPNNAGFGLAINGERTNGLDYRFYRNNTRFGELDARAGYVALDQGPGQPGPSDGTNPFYQGVLGNPTSGAFPYVNPNNPSEPWYETAGGVGKHWNTLEIVVSDGIVYHYITPQGGSPVLISARTDETLTSGHIMMGYADTANNTAALDTRNTDPEPNPLPYPGYTVQDANFGIFDNVVVETITQTRQTWQGAGSANWSNSAAWQNGDIADGVAEVADFTTSLAAPQVVSVDSPRTVRSVTFDSASPNGYTISGANTLTLDSLTSGIRGKVHVKTGSHVISAPLLVKKPLTIDVAAGAQVKIDNLQMDVTALPDYVPDPDALHKRGDGMAEVNVVRVATGLRITSGTLKVTPNGTASGVSVVPNIVLGATGKLDLTDNKLITPMAVGTFAAGAYDGVSGMVDSARGNAGTPLWNGPNGITTSDARAQGSNLVSIGVAKAGNIKGITDTETATFAGQTVLGSDTIAMVTWGGDATLDGKINIDDYGRIDANVASSGTVFGWYNGDFNYDGAINIDDYGIIDGNIANQGTAFPTSAAVGAAGGVSAVPEPASLSLVALGAMSLMRRRRTR